MSLFRRRKYIDLKPQSSDDIIARRERIPDNFATRCPNCKLLIIQKAIGEDRLCPKCEYHMQFPAEDRLKWILDDGSFTEWDTELKAYNPLDFPEYDKKISKGQRNTGLEEAIITGEGRLNTLPVAIAAMENRFMMASMGTIVGEKLTRLFERATEKKLPVVIYVTSGGARMQEGILSLMQMAKVSQAVAKHSQAGLFYCAFLTHPTTGGVTASFGMQGDITLAEPGATIGFAGKRVIEQTINADLPADFQDAEVVLENGFVDQIVSRKNQHDVLTTLLKAHQVEGGAK